MSSKELKRVAEDFSALEALENNDAFADALLDCKILYGNCTAFDEFFSKLECIIMEQAIAEEKYHAKYGHCSDSLPARH